MKEKNFTEKELVSAIRHGGQQRELAIRFIYQHPSYRTGIIRFIRSKGGILQDGEDMFEEGIILLDRNIRLGTYPEKSSLKGYLFNTCHNLWRNQVRKKSRVDLKEDATSFDQQTGTDDPLAHLISKEKKGILGQVLENLGEKCKHILELWKLSYSMEEIAREMQYSSPDLARKYKYRCFNSLKDLLKKNPHLLQMLKG